MTETFSVARSNLIDRLKGKTKLCRRYYKALDANLVPQITALVTGRPIYGYRWITTILNRQLWTEDLAPVNHKGLYLIMQAHGLLLVSFYQHCGLDISTLSCHLDIYEESCFLHRFGNHYRL